MSNEKELIYIEKCAIVPAIVTILLEILKYTGNLNISWFWILSPLWIFAGGYIQMFIYSFFKGFMQGLRDGINK